MPGIRRSLLQKPVQPATAKDRELVDFSRYPFISNNQMQPVGGVSFAKVLEIATEVCHRRIIELTDVRTKGQLERIRRLVREEWLKQKRRKLG